MMERELQFGDVLRITFKNPDKHSWYNGFSAIFIQSIWTNSHMVKIYSRNTKIKIESSDLEVLTYIGSDDLLTYINIL